MKLILRGSTSVVKNHLEDDEEEVDDPAVFADIAGKNDQLQELYDEEFAFTQFCDDGTEFSQSVRDRVKTGGWVSLVYDPDQKKLFVETTYESEEPLTEDEILFLVRETVGQWSDGGGGAAMDNFSESIEPYYVELDEFEPENVKVTVL